MTIKTIKVLGQEWCKPADNARPLEFVTIPYEFGRLVLCRVEQDTETGQVRRVMLKPQDLNKADG